MGSLAFHSCSLPSLAARVLWRIHKDTGIVTDTQLASVEQLEDHVADLPEDKLKELNIDVHNFQNYWSNGCKQYSTADIKHIFGIVCKKNVTTSQQHISNFTRHLQK